MEVTYILTKKEIEDRIEWICVYTALKIVECIHKGGDDEQCREIGTLVKKECLEFFLKESQ